MPERSRKRQSTTSSSSRQSKRPRQDQSIPADEVLYPAFSQVVSEVGLGQLASETAMPTGNINVASTSASNSLTSSSGLMSSFLPQISSDFDYLSVLLSSNQPSIVNVPAPTISAVIPQSGSLAGGMEAIILGQNFTRQHRCIFGNIVCSWTVFWNDGTLRCLVPSGLAPGKVLVSIEGFPVSVGGTTTPEDQTWFEYIPDVKIELYVNEVKATSIATNLDFYASL